MHFWCGKTVGTTWRGKVWGVEVRGEFISMAEPPRLRSVKHADRCEIC
jgi:hypothetical protein